MAYRQTRNHCTTATRNAKRDFFLSTRKNPSLLWRRIKECTGLGKTRLLTSFWLCSTPTLSNASANMINKSFLDKINALKQPEIVVSPTGRQLTYRQRNFTWIYASSYFVIRNLCANSRSSCYWQHRHWCNIIENAKICCVWIGTHDCKIAKYVNISMLISYTLENGGCYAHL